MPRAAAHITQADLARGVRALRQEGHEPEIVYVKGEIRVRPCLRGKGEEIELVDTGPEVRL